MKCPLQGQPKRRTETANRNGEPKKTKRDGEYRNGTSPFHRVQYRFSAHFVFSLFRFAFSVWPFRFALWFALLVRRFVSPLRPNHGGAVPSLGRFPEFPEEPNF